MIIQDAISSGRPFKRPLEHGFIEVHEKRMWHEDNGIYTPTIEDMLADDWELKEPVITLTKTQVINMLDELILADQQEQAVGQIIHKLFGDKL